MKKKKKKETEVRVVKDDFAEIEPVEGMKEKEVKLEEVFRENPEKVKETEKPDKAEPKEVEKPVQAGQKEVDEKKLTEREKARQEAMRELKKLPVDRVETDIDRLMEIIDEKESVSVQDISKKLKIDVEQIEDWAKILEEHGLIEIVYPIIGLPLLRRKKWEKEKKS